MLLTLLLMWWWWWWFCRCHCAEVVVVGAILIVRWQHTESNLVEISSAIVRPFPSPAGCPESTRYKEFLDSLVPPEWFEEQHQIKRDRQEQRRQARIKQKKKSYEVCMREVCRKRRIQCVTAALASARFFAVRNAEFHIDIEQPFHSFTFEPRPARKFRYRSPINERSIVVCSTGLIKHAVCEKLTSPAAKQHPCDQHEAKLGEQRCEVSH